MSILVAGAGRVGRALADGLVAAGLPVERWSRAQAPASGPRDIVIVAVTDAAIAAVAERLVADGYSGPSTILLHCAGAIPAEEAFSSLRGEVGGVGLLHPLRALAGAPSDRDFTGVVFGVEGDAAGRAAAIHLAERLGGRPLVLDAAGLARYHAAAALAGNHTLALVAAAIDVLVGEGLDRGAASVALGELLASAGRNVAARGLPDALTGPIARGDIAVVGKHLAALPEPARSLYRRSAGATVQLARRRGGAPDEALLAIEALLGPHRD